MLMFLGQRIDVPRSLSRVGTPRSTRDAGSARREIDAHTGRRELIHIHGVVNDGTVVSDDLELLPRAVTRVRTLKDCDIRKQVHSPLHPVRRRIAAVVFGGSVDSMCDA